MFYQTRQLVATKDQPFGNHYLRKGESFTASGVDAEYLLRAKKAKLPEAAEQEPPAPTEQETTNFLDFVNDPRVPGLDNLQDVPGFGAVAIHASNDAQPDGTPAVPVQTTDTGTSVQETAENGSEPANTETAAPEARPADNSSAADTPAPRRTITRRSVAQ